VTFDAIETGVASLGDETNSPAIAAPEVTVILPGDRGVRAFSFFKEKDDLK
jgi:hypothetical protein